MGGRFDFSRLSIGSTTDGLKTDKDGSKTIYIQNEKPKTLSNWLPAPEGSFNLTIKMKSVGSGAMH